MIITLAVYTALGVILGGAALSDWIDVRVIGLLTLLLVGTRAGIDFYISATTTPNAQVVATQEKAGAPVIAGPQSQVTTGDTLAPGASVGDIVQPPPPAVRAA
jgi:hypothetical protein